MKLFFSPDYVVLNTGVETLEKASWIVDSLGARPIAGVELVAPPALPRALLHRVHGETYVEAMETGVPRALAESCGIGWSAGRFPSACASTAGCLAAMRAARAEGVSGSMSSGLHHARSTRGAGFCTFNGLALAALAALDEGARGVLILDLDAHFGGGTWSIVAHEPRVQQTDLSTEDYDRWEPDGESSLRLVEDRADYLNLVAETLDRLDARAASFDLCLYNAGVDPCTGGRHDPIVPSVIAARERMVFDWCAARGLPTAFVLAGGYLGGAVTREVLVELHRSTIEAASRAR